MPTPESTTFMEQNNNEQIPAKFKVIKALLDFIRAMRTAPSIEPNEALEWVTLEQEFTQRSNEIQIIH